jgi:hypothetical protein
VSEESENYKDLILFFTNIGEYGGSESFSLENNIQIEKRLRNNNRDNFGETIVIRKFNSEMCYKPIKDGSLEKEKMIESVILIIAIHV